MSDSQHETARVTWRSDRVPVSARFDDPYFSIDSGLAETRHVFLAGNHLPARFRPGFSVAELGFGTGLNLLATWQVWEESAQQGRLRYTSFEAFPMTAEDMARALGAFPQLAPLAQELLRLWSMGRTRFSLGPLEVTVILGDAAQTLPGWSGRADAWYLDGFAPVRNPGLWSASILAEVGAHTRSGGTLATYSAAGHVRRSLTGAGFDIVRVPGFGRKRHMTVGTLRPHP